MYSKEELMKLDKETLVKALLKSEKIRSKQDERIYSLEKELQDYNDAAIARVICKLPD